MWEEARRKKFYSLLPDSESPTSIFARQMSHSCTRCSVVSRNAMEEILGGAYQQQSLRFSRVQSDSVLQLVSLFIYVILTLFDFNNLSSRVQTVTVTDTPSSFDFNNLNSRVQS